MPAKRATESPGESASKNSMKSKSSQKDNSASFPSSKRIKRQEEFAKVFKQGMVAADAVLVIHAVQKEATTTRLGLSVSKKVGNSPQRNRWKRLIRESFRLQYRDLPTNMLLVVRPRRGAVAQFTAVRDSLTSLTKKLARKHETAGATKHGCR